MDKRIFALLIGVLAFMAAAGCVGTSPDVTSPTTTTLSPEPARTTQAGTVTTTGPTITPAESAHCTTHDDCVPAQCCHATACTLKTDAPSCSDIMCSAVCQGPLDCGAGSCGCVEGTCVIESSAIGSNTVPQTPSLTIDASPPRYSPVMSSTPGVKLVPNATGFSTNGATFNWTATTGRFISWGAPDYTIHVLGNPATSTTETVYWTFTERTSSPTIPVTITVIAMDPASSSVLGDARVTLTWDGSYAVIVGNSS